MGIIDWVVGKVRNAVTSLKNMFFAPEEEEVEEYLIDKSREVATGLELEEKINALYQMRKAIEDYSSRGFRGFPSADHLRSTYNTLESEAIDVAIEELKKEIVILQARIALLKELKKKRKKIMPMPLTGYAYLVQVSFKLTIVCKQEGTIVRIGDIKFIKKVSSPAEYEEFINVVLSDPPYHVGDTVSESGKSCIIVDVEPIIDIKEIGSETETRKEEGLSRWTEDV